MSVYFVQSHLFYNYYSYFSPLQSSVLYLSSLSCQVMKHSKEESRVPLGQREEKFEPKVEEKPAPKIQEKPARVQEVNQPRADIKPLPTELIKKGNITGNIFLLPFIGCK